MYYPWVYVKGGIERTILEIAKRSRHKWTVLTSHYRPDETFPEFADLDVRQIGSVSVRRDIWSVARACAQLALRPGNFKDYDALMISCDGIGNLLALRPTGIPLLCLCHTPLKISYDPHARQRWQKLFRPGVLTLAGVGVFRQFDRLAWKRYQRVFCVSREVERRLVQAKVVAPGQTEVVHPGIDMERLVPSGRREDFFLMPGRIMWSKNIELGIEAFKQFMARGDLPGARLVIAGMVDEKSRPYVAHLRQLAAGRDDIEFVEGPSDSELFDLYDRCHAVVFTPPNEDWGIVPLEAMAYGKPVIAVNRGGPAESIAEGETGFLCADDATAFADAMVKMTSSPEAYARMSSAARERSSRYDWQAFVGRIDDYLDQLSSESTVERSLVVEDAHRV